MQSVVYGTASTLEKKVLQQLYKLVFIFLHYSHMPGEFW
jgi:hypothetical protein